MTFTAELRDKITETHIIVQELKHTLLGNGQPGELTNLKGEDVRLSSRLGRLEKTVWLGLGMVLLAGWLLRG